VFIEGGGGTSGKGLEGALPEPEGVVIEVSAEDLDAVDAAAADDVEMGAVVPL